MSKLFIDKGGNKVPVAELELISSKEQLVIGNLDRDLILRTAGNIKIQIRNKFYDLPISTDETSGGTVIGGVTILPTESDLALLVYPGDGQLVYVSGTNALYIASGGTYILINKSTDGTPSPINKIYLSFDEEQSLDGSQKFRVMMNAGYLVSSMDSLSSYIDPANAYTGQIVYSVADFSHYRLVDSTQPAIRESWERLYITTDSGGFTRGGITISPEGSTKQDALLHLVGHSDNLLFDRNTNFNNAFLLADTNLLKGAAWWYDTVGSTYIESLSSTQSKGFNFISSRVPVLTLTAAGSSIYGVPNFNYGLTVNRSTLFNQLVYNNQGYRSTDFLQGKVNGIGYSLQKDGTNKWVLEVDKLIVRNEENVDALVKYDTKSVNGAYWSPTELIITEFEVTDTLEVYTLASAVGSYTFDGTNYNKIPLQDKLEYAEITFTYPGPTDDDDDVEVVQNTLLLYGVGDRDSLGALYSGPMTYVLDDEGNYHTIPPTHYYDGTEWVEDELLATHILSQVITLYKVQTSANKRVNKGDLLFYGTWEADEYNSDTIVAHVEDIVDDEVIVWCFNGELKKGTKVIPVGNSIQAKPSFQINGIDEHSDFIQSYDNIPSFRSMFENMHILIVEIDARVNEKNFIFKADAVTTIGNLYGKVDTALGLTGVKQTGLYSRNAYIQGNFVGNKMILGTELNYDAGVLTIKDLEIIKSRNITGTGALTGGDNLFDSDIQIVHKTSPWIDKPDLTGNNFISNLTFDTWGHLITWTTRAVTTADIPEGGGNLYMTPTNIQIVTDPLYLKLNHPSLQTVLGAVKFTVPTKGVPAVASDDYVTLSQLTVSVSDYVINVPLAGVKDGSNQLFSLPEAFAPNTVQLYVNGVRQGVGIDYIELTNTIIEFTLAPLSTAHIVADYRRA